MFVSVLDGHDTLDPVHEVLASQAPDDVWHTVPVVLLDASSVRYAWPLLPPAEHPDASGGLNDPVNEQPDDCVLIRIRPRPPAPPSTPQPADEPEVPPTALTVPL